MLQGSPYCVVQVFGPGKQVESVSDECNVPIAGKSVSPWPAHDYFTTTDRNRQGIAHNHVECGIMRPNEQGVHIPQGVAKFSILKCELGKRKLQDDIELDERRMSLDERRMQLQTQSIENDKQRVEIDKQRVEIDKQRIEIDKQRAENRISAVFKCMEAMTALDPSWKNNHRMVLQLQEVLINGILHDYSTSAGSTGSIGGGKMKARQRRLRFPSDRSR